MNRRQFLGGLSALTAFPLSADERRMTRPTAFLPCTCGDFEPGPVIDDTAQCENCRGWRRMPSRYVVSYSNNGHISHIERVNG